MVPSQDVLNVITGLVILVGSIACFFGYQIFKFILGLTGFLVVGALAAAVGYAISQQESVALLAGLVGGFIGAVLMVVLYFVGIFMTGALLGGFLGVLLSAAANRGPEPAVLLILAVIAGVIALKFQKFMIIISTGFGGAWVVVAGIAYFTLTSWDRLLIASDPRKVELLFRSGGSLLYAIVLCWFALGMVGVIVQYKSPRTMKEETQPPTAPEEEKPAAEVPYRTPRYVGALWTIAFLMAIALLFFVLAKRTRSPGRALTTGQHPRSDSASTVVPQPTRIGIIEAPEIPWDNVARRVRPAPYAGGPLGMEFERYHATVQDGQRIIILGQLPRGGHAGTRQIRAGKKIYTFDDPGPAARPETFIELPDGTTGWVLSSLVHETTSRAPSTQQQASVPPKEIAEPISVVWSDEFETYATGSFPTAWTPNGNADDMSNNYVTTDVSSQGTKSLRLHGHIGGCWGALAFHPLSVFPPFEVQVTVRNGSESLNGCHPERAYLYIRQGLSWRNPSRKLVSFMGDGNIVGSEGTVLQTYSTLTWYTIKIRYERPSSTSVRLSYWINGVFKGEETLTAQAQEDQLTNLDLTVQEGTAWFDGVIVTQ
jgi:MFS family permease